MTVTKTVSRYGYFSASFSITLVELWTHPQLLLHFWFGLRLDRHSTTMLHSLDVKTGWCVQCNGYENWSWQGEVSCLTFYLHTYMNVLCNKQKMACTAICVSGSRGTSNFVHMYNRHVYIDMKLWGFHTAVHMCWAGLINWSACQFAMYDCQFSSLVYERLKTHTLLMFMCLRNISMSRSGNVFLTT